MDLNHNLGMGIEDQLGEQPEFDRKGTLQELFDQTTKVQLDVGDALAKLYDKSPDEPATVGELMAVAAVQGARQCLLEIHFAVTGEPPTGA